MTAIEKAIEESREREKPHKPTVIKAKFGRSVERFK
jgi:hypothetical protein